MDELLRLLAGRLTSHHNNEFDRRAAADLAGLAAASGSAQQPGTAKIQRLQAELSEAREQVGRLQAAGAGLAVAAAGVAAAGGDEDAHADEGFEVDEGGGGQAAAEKSGLTVRQVEELKDELAVERSGRVDAERQVLFTAFPCDATGF